MCFSLSEWQELTGQPGFPAAQRAHNPTHQQIQSAPPLGDSLALPTLLCCARSVSATALQSQRLLSLTVEEMSSHHLPPANPLQRAAARPTVQKQPLLILWYLKLSVFDRNDLLFSSLENVSEVKRAIGGRTENGL